MVQVHPILYFLSAFSVFAQANHSVVHSAMASMEVDDKDVLDPQDLEDLYSWIDAVPLSRAKKNIARDFSDGVCVAEIVHHYLPKMVELHNYVNANSTGQKRINWNMLGRKVFVKLNLKLNEKLVENVIEAKPGAIEQILWDLRKKVVELGNRTTLPRSNTNDNLKKKGSGQLPSYGEHGIKKPAPAPPTHQSRVISKMTTPRVAQATPQASKRVSPHAKRGDGLSYSAGLKEEVSHYGGLGSSLRPDQDPAYPGIMDMNANGNADATALPPAHLIYKGHKMVPSILLDMKNRQIKDLESVIGGLQKKVNFLDNLIQLKDNRVEDLTRQLHSLRSKFQELTHTELPTM